MLSRDEGPVVVAPGIGRRPTDAIMLFMVLFIVSFYLLFCFITVIYYYITDLMVLPLPGNGTTITISEMVMVA